MSQVAVSCSCCPRVYSGLEVLVPRTKTAVGFFYSNAYRYFDIFGLPPYGAGRVFELHSTCRRGVLYARVGDAMILQLARRVQHHLHTRVCVRIYWLCCSRCRHFCFVAFLFFSRMPSMYCCTAVRTSTSFTIKFEVLRK